MSMIQEHFSGYLTIDEKVFGYTADNHRITLLPSYPTKKEQFEAIDWFKVQANDLTECLYGTDNNSSVAFVRNGDISTDMFMPIASFSSPFIIKAAGNADGFYKMLTCEWKKYHAITFFGMSINSIFNPQIADANLQTADINTVDGALEQKTRPWKEYTLESSFEIFGENTSVVVSVTQGIGSREEDGAYNLGKLNSYIRLSFEKAHSFNEIQKYYNLVRRLLSLLLKQQDVDFGFFLSQRLPDGRFYKTAICKAAQQNIPLRFLSSARAINIDILFPSLQLLLQGISEKKYDILISVLPEWKQRGFISFSNIQDLCTALEIAYRWENKENPKDDLIQELKRELKQTIKEFIDVHPELDVNQQTNISGAFQHLELTLKNKVLYMCKINEQFLKCSNAIHFTPPLNDQNIGAFIKLRNGKTHDGFVEWNDSAQIFEPLIALVYVELFKSINIDNETIKDIMRKCF